MTPSDARSMAVDPGRLYTVILSNNLSSLYCIQPETEDTRHNEAATMIHSIRLDFTQESSTATRTIPTTHCVKVILMLLKTLKGNSPTPNTNALMILMIQCIKYPKKVANAVMKFVMSNNIPPIKIT